MTSAGPDPAGPPRGPWDTPPPARPEPTPPVADDAPGRSGSGDQRLPAPGDPGWASDGDQRASGDGDQRASGDGDQRASGDGGRRPPGDGDPGWAGHGDPGWAGYGDQRPAGDGDPGWAGDGGQRPAGDGDRRPSGDGDPGWPGHGDPGWAGHGAQRPPGLEGPSLPPPAYLAGSGGEWPAPARREPRRPGRAALVALAAIAVITALGAPLGLLWARLAPGVPIIKTEQGAVFAEPSPEEFIAADGWFTLLGLGFGVLAAILVWYALRRYRGPVGMVTVALGAVGAGWLAWQVGRQIGREAFRRAVDTAAVGDLLVRPPDLRAGGFERLWDVVPIVRGDILMPAFGAVVAYTLLAGWSRYTTLRKETEPSWGSPAPPAPAAAPAPPEPDAAAPPPG